MIKSNEGIDKTMNKKRFLVKDILSSNKFITFYIIHNLTVIVKSILLKFRENQFFCRNAQKQRCGIIDYYEKIRRNLQVFCRFLLLFLDLFNTCITYFSCGILFLHICRKRTSIFTASAEKRWILCGINLH